MQLVGAPFAYVRGPFVVEGMLQGGTGALVAVLLLWAVFRRGPREVRRQCLRIHWAGVHSHFCRRRWAS